MVPSNPGAAQSLPSHPATVKEETGFRVPFVNGGFWLALWVVMAVSFANSQVTLDADGPGNTYELINSVLGGTAEEVPDCSHPDFGRHIAEAWDDILGRYVFVFYIHVTPDNDRCSAFDRQRNEIKTYGPSPAYVKGMYGDLCSYRWKFKLDAAFQPSPNFTHIHQIKAGDGTDADSPIISITPRYASPERLELIYTAPTGLSGSGTKATATLSNFKGQWIEAFERTLYASNGTYELTLRRVSDAAVLLSYTNNNLNMWRGDATFNRPKWGIYRSLNSSNYLRDEQVLFASFCIAKGNDTCPSDVVAPPLFTLTASPASQTVNVGGNTSYTVTMATNTGFTGSVSFALTGLPADASDGFNPASLSGPGSTVLSVRAAATTSPGNYSFTIRGTNSSGATNAAVGNIIILPPPVIGTIRISGGNVVLSGANGAPGKTYYILASTNLAWPLSQWQPISTNAFDTNGNFTVTNAPGPIRPKQFYRLKLP